MYTIGKLAEQASINIETVRYYERRGLIEKPEKPHLGYRLYPLATLNRIKFIKRSQDLGFTLEEISNLLSLNDTPCIEVQEMTLHKLASVKAKIAGLRRLETVLTELLNECNSNTNQSHCPIIDSLLPED
ncbi:Hg(II)-responsive transcriptional regulator [Aeromonas sp. 55A]|uniref:Hg(II)-responsive transcriptional regulator n=1 Tax=Aeromonas sp. 55A TaxID=3452720 RepID=UPI003F7ABC3A